MLGWLRGTPKIPDGMLKLNALPVDEDGAPAWSSEIETATERFGTDFLVPFMFEISPGTCIGGFAAKARLQTSVRAYEARATLIQRKNDEFRTTIVVTAPSVPARDGDPWPPYTYVQNTSLAKENVRGLVNAIRQHCEQCHSDELQKRTKMASISVNPGKWEVLGGGSILDYGVVRTWSWSGFPEPNTTASLRIECGLTSFEANRVVCRLNLRFRPIKIQQTATLVMALFTEEPKGGFVEVQAIPMLQEWRINNSSDFDIAMNIHEDDVPKCLDALCSGTPFNFGLLKPVEPTNKTFLSLPPDFIVRLSVPNDLDFKRLYEQSYSQIERSHEATRARHLGEGWYRRRAAV